MRQIRYLKESYDDENSKSPYVFELRIRLGTLF